MIAQAKKKKDKLKIAHLHWGFPPIIGGVETHLTILLPAMVEKGHQVSLLTGSVEGTEQHAAQHVTYKGVEVYRTPLMDLNWLYKRGTVGLEDEVVKIFDDFLKASEPDIVHVHNMHYFSQVHTRVLERLVHQRNIPLFLTAHNVWDDNLYLDLTRHIGWDHIIAVSHFIKSELMGCGVDDRKITVVHHGIDHEHYKAEGGTANVLKKYPQLRDRPILFHPARMGLAKGCDVSIKALNLIRERIPNILLILAGTKHIIDWGATQQKDIAYMINLVDFFNLRKNLLIDAFPLDWMPELYRVSDVCFYPSTVSEPFGLTMLEALSSERPMIVTKMGGMPEIIRDGVNGFVIPVRDYEALASRTIQLLENKRLCKRFGYTGRQMVEQSYTKEVVTCSTLALYHGVKRKMSLKKKK